VSCTGGSVLDPEVVAYMVGGRRREGPLVELAPREREVLELMAQGLSNKPIREQLVATERAVEHHVTSIFGKLELTANGREHRRVLAVLTYLQG
jgi:DNA-binding NarL/FixJ family response regulator